MATSGARIGPKGGATTIAARPATLADAASSMRETARLGGDGDAGGVKMSEAEFARVSELVGKLTGIVIKDHKREMIQSRLTRRLRARGMATFAQYFALLDSDRGGDELGELVNAVTTNLTAFFRESHHFDHLKAAILDPMAAENAPRIRIWSSACSSGEEPYSIAATVLGSAAARHRNLKILATDLDTNILAKAQRGVYPDERVKSTPEALRKLAFRQAAGGEWAVSAEAKALITFRQLNLLHDWPVQGPFDVIFCRNVLIYFDNPTKKGIVDRMAKLLRPNGALYLGHSESLLGDHPLLLGEGRTIYRRRP